MAKGTVKFFNNQKNFGFISDDDSDTEYFVHGSHVEGTIRDNDKVEFTPGESDRGPRAENVKRIDADAAPAAPAEEAPAEAEEESAEEASEDAEEPAE